MICWLLQLNPGLTKLHLVDMTLSNTQLVQVSNRTLSGLSRLRDLDLESSYIVSMYTKSIFLSCPVSLEVLSLNFHVYYNLLQLGSVSDVTIVLQEEAAGEDGDDDEGFPVVVQRNGPLPNLTKLIMPTTRTGLSTSAIEFFLRDCSSLQM